MTAPVDVSAVPDDLLDLIAARTEEARALLALARYYWDYPDERRETTGHAVRLIVGANTHIRRLLLWHDLREAVDTYGAWDCEADGQGNTPWPLGLPSRERVLVDVDVALEMCVRQPVTA